MSFRVATLALLLWAGCSASRSCVETCQRVVEEGCEAPGMQACEPLCAQLALEAQTAGCTERWLDLEYCMGLDPVCAGDSRCGEARGAYNGCLREYCDANPAACGP